MPQLKEQKQKPNLVYAKPEDPENRLINIRFSRTGTQTHPCKFGHRKRIDGKVYDWKGQLDNGKEYKLPKFLVDHLIGLSTPIYGEVPVAGTKSETETKVIGRKQRFNVQILDY